MARGLCYLDVNLWVLGLVWYLTTFKSFQTPLIRIKSRVLSLFKYLSIFVISVVTRSKQGYIIRTAGLEVQHESYPLPTVGQTLGWPYLRCPPLTPLYARRNTAIPPHAILHPRAVMMMVVLRDVHMIIEGQVLKLRKGQLSANFFSGPLHNMESNVKLKNKVQIES